MSSTSDFALSQRIFQNCLELIDNIVKEAVQKELQKQQPKPRPAKLASIFNSHPQPPTPSSDDDSDVEEISHSSNHSKAKSKEKEKVKQKVKAKAKGKEKEKKKTTKNSKKRKQGDDDDDEDDAADEKKSKKSKKNDGEKKKKPLSAYAYYCTQLRPLLQADLPKSDEGKFDKNDIGEVNRELGKRWKALKKSDQLLWAHCARISHRMTETGKKTKNIASSGDDEPKPKSRSGFQIYIDKQIEMMGGTKNKETPEKLLHDCVIGWARELTQENRHSYEELSASEIRKLGKPELSDPPFMRGEKLEVHQRLMDSIHYTAEELKRKRAAIFEEHGKLSEAAEEEDEEGEEAAEESAAESAVNHSDLTHDESGSDEPMPESDTDEDDEDLNETQTGDGAEEKSVGKYNQSAAAGVAKMETETIENRDQAKQRWD